MQFSVKRWELQTSMREVINLQVIRIKEKEKRGKGEIIRKKGKS